MLMLLLYVRVGTPKALCYIRLQTEQLNFPVINL
jgi:hypothetical protein